MANKIDIDAIKRISIVDMLSRSGIEPVSRRGSSFMYLSPLRADTHPSFSVDAEKNLWHDHGSGEGGSIIDLVMKMGGLSYMEAVHQLNDDVKAVHIDAAAYRQAKAKERVTVVVIDKVRPIGNNPVLNTYLQERGIAPEEGRQVDNLAEVYYTIGQKRYFAIGFKNDKGGYELRNRYFKGCGGHKDITTIYAEKGQVSREAVVVEGFMDYVSMVAATLGRLDKDVVVLNSVAMIGRAVPFLAQHEVVHAAVDADAAGDKVVAHLKEVLGEETVKDARGVYKRQGFKDYNEYHVNERKRRQAVVHGRSI